MSILKLLHHYADLDNRSVQDMAEAEIIRIEKKLKAEVKLSQNIDLNDVDMILLILRNNKPELKILYHPWYRKLREILTQPTIFTVSSQVEIFSFAPNEKFNDFISKYFGKTLSEYASFCIQQDHYNALNTLLLYKEILPAVLLDDISKKCKQKIEFGTECINVKSQNIQQKIECLTNPYFYRCLNKLGAVGYESPLIELLNTGIENLQKTNKALFVRFLYAAGFFEPVRSDLKTVFTDNQNMAFGHGVREKKYISHEKDQKGGTYQVSTGIFSGSQSSQSGQGKSKSGRGAGIGAFGGGVVIILILIKVIIFGSRMNRNEYKMPEYYEMPTYNDDFGDGSDAVFDTMLCSINEKAMYMQTGDLDVREENDIEFKIEETNFSLPFMTEDDKRLTYTNNTSQPVVILFSASWAIFLDVGESASTHYSNHKFAIYTGIGPQIVEYKDSAGLKKEDFRFRYFTESDEETLAQIYDFPEVVAEDSNTIEITDENNFVEVKMRTTVEVIFEENYSLE